jgi:DNA-binding NarL/FixJ family response regulator
MKIWQELMRWFQKRRVFTLDADSFDSLQRMAKQEGAQPQEVAARLVQAAVAEQAVTQHIWECWETLTPREKQVTALVCRGYTNRQIAAFLGLGPATIKTYAVNSLRKFSLPNRTELRKLLAAWDLSEYE